MQAINAARARLKRRTIHKSFPSGWWLAPAIAVSLGLWALIFKIVL
jgi:hypothetical protein